MPSVRHRDRVLARKSSKEKRRRKGVRNRFLRFLSEKGRPNKRQAPTTEPIASEVATPLKRRER